MDTSLDSLTPDTRAKVEELVRLAKAKGYTLKVRSTRRSCAEQNELYGIGRTYNLGSPIVTQARGCVSWHVLGRAVDVDIVTASGKAGTDADYRVMGALAQSIGMVWGGAWRNALYDPGHVEWHPGLDIEDVCPNPDDCEGGLARSMSIGEGAPAKWAAILALAGLAMIAYGLTD